MELSMKHMVVGGLVVATAACGDQIMVPAEPEYVASAATRGGERISDQYIVVFHESTDDVPGRAGNLARAHGGRIRHVYPHVLGGFSVNISAEGAAALARNPHVAYVKQDEVVTIAQWDGWWGLDRVDQRNLPLNHHHKFNRNGSGVTVYVIDTGIKTSHSQFNGRASIGYDAFGGTGQDCHGHGTHVAGIVGADTWGTAPGVNLVGVRVFDCYGNGDWSDVIAGINWVRVNHVSKSIANLSLAGSGFQPVDDALEDLIAAGVTAVVAAGNHHNSNACLISPARVATAITVAASDSTDTQAAFSNSGGCVDLYAPGVDIRSTWITANQDTVLSGTSMAAPFVSGAAALHIQGTPGATPTNVHSAVVANSTPNVLSGLGIGSPNRMLHAIFGRWPIHRLYSPWTYTHGYSRYPWDWTIGGMPEYQNYFYIESGSASGRVPLYRCLVAGSHRILTTGSNCEGATFETVLGHIATSQITGTTALYRLHKSSIPNTFYTTDWSEVVSAVNDGYSYVGVTGYVHTSAW